MRFSKQSRRYITATPIEVIPFAVVLLTWYLATLPGGVDPVFLPTPIAVSSSLVGLVSGAFLQQHLLPSAARVTAAFLISVCTALPVGMLCAQIPAIRRLLIPPAALVRYLPVPALVPLCILWFGIGNEQKVAVITIGVVFQLVILLAYDCATVPTELIDTARTLGFNRWQIVRRVVLPAALPAIWDHLRVSAGWAWSYLVLAELVAGDRGVGYYVVQSQRYLQTEKVFAGILFVGGLGAATDLFFRITGSRLFRWL